VPPRGDANVGLWQPRTITLPVHRIALLSMSAGPDLLVTAGAGGSVKLAADGALRALAAEAGVRLPTRAAAVTEALAALLLGASSTSVAAASGQQLTAAATAAAAAAVAVLGGGGGGAAATAAAGRGSGDSGSSGLGAPPGGLLGQYGPKINDSAASIGQLRRALIGAEAAAAAAPEGEPAGGAAGSGGSASQRSRAAAVASGGSTAGSVAGRQSSEAWPLQQRLEPDSPWIIEFGDLKLGRVVGEGSYGHVRIGWWHETEVAVKVGLGGIPGSRGAGPPPRRGSAAAARPACRACPGRGPASSKRGAGGGGGPPSVGLPKPPRPAR
jgi:hypothetical protein